MNAIQQQEVSERIANDLAEAVDAWLVPELEKVLGKKMVIGIKDQDFDSILATQYQGLWLKRSHTIKEGECIYYFKLMKREIQTGKDHLLSKFEWKLIPEDYWK